MKNTLLALLFICPLFLWADSWDNLTLEQAEDTQAFLSTNPYILDYCDCCDSDGQYATKIYLMKVVFTQIVVCDWDPDFYSIKAETEILAEIPYTPNGPNMGSPNITRSKSDLTISMNYTWAYNKQKFAPLHTIIPYDVYGEQNQNTGSCREFTTFPNPGFINDNDYSNWYSSRF